MKSAIIENCFDDRPALLAALYERVIKALQYDLNSSGKASMLLSGGTTPEPLYEKLSEANLPWQNIQVGLVDERWVDKNHDASNERLLRNTLLKNDAQDAEFSAMKNTSQTAKAGEAQCNVEYATLAKPYSFCLLGMGPDGHTASLFPNAEGLPLALDTKQHCVAIKATQSAVTGEYTERMTMTPWVLLQSRVLVLLITGEEKWQVFQQAKQEQNIKGSPISLFLQQEKVPLEVYWAP